MMYSLPFAVDIDGKQHKIRNKCDFRIILDVIEALNDNELSEQEKIQVALFIFFEPGELESISNFDEAVKQMFFVINGGSEEQEITNKPPVMNWQHDFQQIAPPVSRILGYDVRLPEKYTHWWTFIGGYMEIGDCTFANIVSIRNKRIKGKKLEKWEQEFYRENHKMIDLPQNLTAVEKEFLDSDW